MFLPLVRTKEFGFQGRHKCPEGKLLDQGEHVRWAECPRGAEVPGRGAGWSEQACVGRGAPEGRDQTAGDAWENASV